MASTIAMRAAAPRQCHNFLAGFQDSFERVVQGFRSALKHRSSSACKPSVSCIPALLTGKNKGHFSSLVNRIATWPRLANRRSRERSSPNPQAPQPAAGSSSSSSSTRAHGCRYSFSFPVRGVPPAAPSLDVTGQPHKKFNSNSFKTSFKLQPSSSRGNNVEPPEAEVHAGMSTAASHNNTIVPFSVNNNNAASPDEDTVFWNGLHEIAMLEDSKIYILDGIPEVQHRINYCAAAAAESTPHRDSDHHAWFEIIPTDYDSSVGVLTSFVSEAEHDGAGDSSITTVSAENETGTAASSQLDQLLLLQQESRGLAVVPDQRSATRTQFKGIRPKDNKWISEIRPPCSKRTVWLGTYATPEEAARAYDAGIFYYHKYKTPYNFPDSPKLFPAINEGPKEVSVEFVKTEAKRNAERAWPSGAPQPSASSTMQEQAASMFWGSSGGSWFHTPCKRRKSGFK